MTEQHTINVSLSDGELDLTKSSDQDGLLLELAGGVSYEAIMLPLSNADDLGQFQQWLMTALDMVAIALQDITEDDTAYDDDGYDPDYLSKNTRRFKALWIRDDYSELGIPEEYRAHVLAIEIQGCTNLGKEYHPDRCEVTTNFYDIDLFSVYLKVGEGGIECVGDFADKVDAVNYAYGLRRALGVNVRDLSPRGNDHDNT